MRISRLVLMTCMMFLIGAGRISAQWTQTNGTSGGAIRCFTVGTNGTGGTNLFAGISGGVLRSTDHGTNWNAVNTGLSNLDVWSLAASGTDLFTGTNGGGIYHSTNYGTTWIVTGSTTTDVLGLTVNGKNLFAGTYYGSGVILSTDNGNSWTAANVGLTSYYVNVLTFNGTNLFAGTLNGGVFLSSNNGANWAATGLINIDVYAIAAIGTNLFAGTWGGGVFLSTNNGISWNAVNAELSNLYPIAFAVSGSNLFAGTYGDGVFLSTNNGTSWNAVNSGLSNLDVQAMVIDGANLFAGTYGNGVWRRPLSELVTPVELTSFTANISNGNISLNWKTATELNNMGFNVERSVNKTDWTKVAFVKGNGNSVSEKDYSYADKSVSSAGKYYYRLKQLDNDGSFKFSDIVEADLNPPSAFTLNQNYPNPFNPSTTISYRLKEKGFVKLKVYDIKGDLIKVLVNETKESGYYEAEFNAKGLTSGIYLYRIEVIGNGNKQVYSDMKKTLLIK